MKVAYRRGQATIIGAVAIMLAVFAVVSAISIISITGLGSLQQEKSLDQLLINHNQEFLFAEQANGSTAVMIWNLGSSPSVITQLVYLNLTNGLLSTSSESVSILPGTNTTIFTGSTQTPQILTSDGNVYTPVAPFSFTVTLSSSTVNQAGSIVGNFTFSAVNYPFAVSLYSESAPAGINATYTPFYLYPDQPGNQAFVIISASSSAPLGPKDLRVCALSQIHDSYCQDVRFTVIS